MRKLVVVGMLCLIFATSVDAAPRNRRRSRRARRAASTQRIRYSNNVVAVESSRVPADSAAVMPAQPSTPQQQPIVLASGPTVVPLVIAEQALAEEISTTTVDNAIPTVGDGLPSVDVTASVQSEEQASPSDTVSIPAAQPEPVNPALAELNMIRRRRGLFPLLEDRVLSTVAYRKAAIQASRGYMGHPGGSMGGARFEGVGMGNQFTTCYQDATNARYAGAATVVGRNGRRYHCLLLR